MFGREAVGRLTTAIAPHGPFDHVTKSQAPSTPAEIVATDSTRPTRILSFGLIRPYKGIEDLIHTFDAMTPEQAAQFEIDVVGETWESWTTPADAIAASRYRDRIRFENRYVTDTEAAEYFAAADVLVLPYRRGSASGPLQIAMNNGIFVVLYAVGGPRRSRQGLPGRHPHRARGRRRTATGAAEHRRPPLRTLRRPALVVAAGARRRIDDRAEPMTASIIDRPIAVDRDESERAEIATPTVVVRLLGRMWQWVLGWPFAAVGAALGTVVIGLSYRFSTLGYSADLYYLVFWAGMLLACVPAAVRLLAESSSRGSRLGMILILGVMTAMPKYLRNPFKPSYHDEYAHWREAIDVASTGHLFQPNTTIPIVEYFPGTSALTVAAHSLTGTSFWSSGVLVVLVMHVLGLFAVYLLGEELLGSSRAGAVAALVYAVNPSAVLLRHAVRLREHRDQLLPVDHRAHRTRCRHPVQTRSMRTSPGSGVHCRRLCRHPSPDDRLPDRRAVGRRRHGCRARPTGRPPARRPSPDRADRRTGWPSRQAPAPVVDHARGDRGPRGRLGDLGRSTDPRLSVALPRHVDRPAGTP